MNLIGTIHFDFEGPKRLEVLLAKLKPKSISIEYPTTNESLEDIEQRIINARAKYKRVLKQLSIPEVLQRFFTEFFSILAYEAVLPIQYSKARGIKVYPVDHPSMLGKPFTEEAILEDMRSGLGFIPPQINDFKYDHLRKQFVQGMDKGYYDSNVFHEIDKIFPPTQPAFIYEPRIAEMREQYMAEQILKINPDLHIGGLDHIFREQSDLPVKTLTERLGDKVSEKIRLCEATHEKVI